MQSIRCIVLYSFDYHCIKKTLVVFNYMKLFCVETVWNAINIRYMNLQLDIGCHNMVRVPSTISYTSRR